MKLPETTWVRRADILRSDLGVTRYDIEAVVDDGSLRGTVFPGKKRAKFLRQEVLRVFGVPKGS
jgi:hypothetical protein